MEESDIVLRLYSIDSSRLSEQLKSVLVIRGWSISLFSLLIVGSISLRHGYLALIGLLVILVFYSLEVVYDSYRILMFERIKYYEIWLTKNAKLPEDFSKVLTGDGATMMVNNLKNARFKAATLPMRVLVYSVFAVVALFASLFL